MKLEKRCGAGSPEEPESKGQKPVIVYIMILFIAAFLMMALSFFMHQRSNTEALGQIQSSVSAMQEMQETQEHVLQLQKELAKANETINELSEYKGQIERLENQLSHEREYQEQAMATMDYFWRLNEAYVLGSLEQCREILEEYSQTTVSPMEGYLSGEASERYEEICAALSEEDASASEE